MVITAGMVNSGLGNLYAILSTRMEMWLSFKILNRLNDAFWKRPQEEFSVNCLKEKSLLSVNDGESKYHIWQISKTIILYT